MKEAFLRDEKNIYSYLQGDYRIGSPGVEGMNTLFSIQEVNKTVYGRGFHVYCKDTYAYANKRPEGYKETICIYYINYAKERYCRKGNFLSFDIYSINNVLYYIPPKMDTSNPFERVLKPCPISMDDIIKILNIDDEAIFEVGRELTLIGTKLYNISDEIVFAYKGYRYYAIVEDVLNIDIVKEDNDKKYKVRYLLNYRGFREKVKDIAS